MTPLEYELAHLVNLAAPPFRDNWLDYVRAKAQFLSERRAQHYAGLSEMLDEALGFDAGKRTESGTSAASTVPGDRKRGWDTPLPRLSETFGSVG